VFLLALSYQKYILTLPIPDILFYLSVVVVALIWYAHRENIKRLIKGQESKVSFSSSKK
jgi:glycerol-3-phosphate acyltransferase PlsY